MSQDKIAIDKTVAADACTTTTTSVTIATFITTTSTTGSNLLLISLIHYSLDNTLKMGMSRIRVARE